MSDDLTIRESASDRVSRQAILLLAHGSPDRVEDIPEYLRNVTGGRPLPEPIVREVEQRYRLIGRSPLTEITLRLAEGVSAESGLPVYVGMRNWRPYIGDALLLCVFRDPSVTASSTVRECKRADHMKGTAVDERWALKVWEAMYRYILEVHYPQGGDWLFVHYDQLLDHCADAELERRLGVRIDREFAVAELNRSRPNAVVPRRMARLYERLCALARYEIGRRTAAPA